MAGIITAITLLTNRFVFVKSIFAFSNLPTSNFCVLNALITSIPSIFSRVTKFNLSIRFCTALNFGIASENRSKMIPSKVITATPIIHDIEVLLEIAFIIPPIPKIGA